MSDTVLKLIPTEPRHVPAAETHEKALEVLVELTQGWEPEAQVFDQLQYIDPDEWIEAINCPRCGKRLELDGKPEHEAYWDWYNEIVEQEEEHGAESLQVVMPCCKASVPFTDLQIVNGGFAMFELQVSDPEVDCPMPADMQSKVEQAVGCRLKQVWARY